MLKLPRSYNSYSLLADALWKHLDQLNQSLAQTLLHLSKLHDQDSENYKNAVKYISSLHSVQASPLTSHLEMSNLFAFSKWDANPLQPAAELPVVKAFSEAHNISQVFEIQALRRCLPLNSNLQEVRSKMKQMGDFSGVPIEPAEQTRLLDICISLPGVIGGGVPGGKQFTFFVRFKFNSLNSWRI